MALEFCQSSEIFTNFSLDSRKEQHRYDVESAPLFQCGIDEVTPGVLHFLPVFGSPRTGWRAAYVTGGHFVLCQVYTIEYSMNAFAVEGR